MSTKKKPAKKSDKSRSANARKAKGAKRSEPKGPQRIKIERYAESLVCALTTAEVSERADRAAHLISEHDQAESQMKEEAKLQKANLSKLASEIRRLSGEVREKVTYRNVSCERRYLYDEGKVVDIRTDNGEKIGERPMTDAERQIGFEFPGDDPKPPEGGGDLDDEFGDPSATPDKANEDQKGDGSREGHADEQPPESEDKPNEDQDDAAE